MPASGRLEGVVRLLLVLILIGSVGCSTVKGWVTPKTQGTIYVSRPQVFTRERLLNARLQESRWLTDQLDKEVKPSFQGLIDERMFRGVYENLTASYSPLAGAASDTALREQAQANRRLTEINDLKQQVDLLKLQQDIAAQRTRTTGETPQFTGTSQATSQEAVALGARITALETKITDLTTELKAAKATPLGISNAYTKPALTPDPARIVTTQAQLTSKEGFEDAAAYRDLVSSRMREKQLDDTHDLRGSTIYEFKFDVALTPGENTRQFGVAKLELQPGGRIAIPGLIKRWEEFLRAEIFDEMVRWQDRTPIQLTRAMALRAFEILKAQKESRKEECLGADPSNGTPSEMSPPPAKPASSSIRPSAVLQYPTLTLQARIATAKNERPDVISYYRCGVALAVREKYKQALGDYVTFTPMMEERVNERPAWISKMSVNSANAAALTERLGVLMTDALSIWVASIEPKEYVQNLSDVAAQESLTNLMLALSATLPQGIGLQNQTQFLKQSQTLLQAIRRQPLAVSYGHETNVFGWILGPKFAIEERQARFLHAVGRHTFTASVVVPAWWPEVRIKGTTGWLSDTGIVSKRQNMWTTSCDRVQSCTRVLLPGRVGALTAALAGEGLPLLRDPEIFREGGDATTADGPVRAAPIYLKAGPAQSIVIRGLDLWRNPEVFIGGQRASKVELLPDMNGLLARFDRLEVPAAPDTTPRAVSLKVVTSVGSDELEEYVVVVPDAAAETRPFAQLTSTYVVGKRELRFAVVPELFPRDYRELTLRVGPRDSPGTWLDVPSTMRRPSEEEVTFPLDVTLPTAWGSAPIELVAELRLQPRPGVEPRSVLRDGREPFVYFADDAQRSGDLAEKEISFTAEGQLAVPRDLVITLPSHIELLKRAYPGLAAALSSGGQVDLVARSGAGVDVARLTAEARDGKRFVVTASRLQQPAQGSIIPDRGTTETTAKYTLSLQIVGARGRTLDLPIKSELVVKRKVP